MSADSSPIKSSRSLNKIETVEDFENQVFVCIILTPPTSMVTISKYTCFLVGHIVKTC